MQFEPIELRQQAEDNRQSSIDVINPKIKYKVIVKSKENPFLETELPASLIVSNLLTEITNLYKNLLEAGVARECARMILPECTSTTILMTGNIRSWIHFLALRNDVRAQKEIQLIAKEIEAKLCEEVPSIFKK